MDVDRRRLRLFGRLREVRALRTAAALLQWDQETLMPPRGVEGRAAALATLSGLAHERFTDGAVGDDLAALAGAPRDEDDAAILREVARDLDRATRVPRPLVERMAESESRAVEAWQRARTARRFRDFQPHLERLLALKREYAAAVGYAAVPLDALLEDHERGATVAALEGTFDRLESALLPLLHRVRGASHRPDDSPLLARVALPRQLEFAREVVAAMGFDLDSGRMDRSAHPFCTGIHEGDVRLTWRGAEDDLRPLLFGLVHEAGHGLYEQGLEDASLPEPLREAASLGVHESQSRLWENLIARGLPFWRRFLPRLADRAGGALAGVSPEAMAAAANVVRPSFIRVEADALTYDLHVALRFRLERDLFSGALAADDLPAAWNDRFEALLGIRPAHDADGVLQDIHWAMGAFGYFPTYTLGNLYAAQLDEAARRALPDLDRRIEDGDLRALREWLREHVHRHGRRFAPAELIERATGAKPSAEPFLRRMTRTVEAAYRL